MHETQFFFATKITKYDLSVTFTMARLHSYVGFLLRAPLIKKSIVQILVEFHEEIAGAAMLKSPYHQATANLVMGYSNFIFLTLILLIRL